MTSETLKTIGRTLRVLSAFDRANPQLSVAEISSRLDISRTVITRIVATLENARYLERVEGSTKYRVGIAACELGALYLSGHSIVDASRHTLLGLADDTSFTVYLGACHGADVVILSAYEGRTPVRFIWSVGDRLPLATTALGKALLLHIPTDEIDRILGLKELEGLTDASITERAVLDAQLEQYRDKGWMPAFEEAFPGVYAVGAAILDAGGMPVAGISLSFLAAGSDVSLVETMGSKVVEAARAISGRIAPHHAYATGRMSPLATAPRSIPQRNNAVLSNTTQRRREPAANTKGT